MTHFFFLAVTLLLLGCGGPSSNSCPVLSANQLKIYLFASPTCGPCDVELPALSANLKNKLGTRYSHLQVKVYVLNGTNNVRPTQAIADDYKASFARLGKPVDFEFVADGWIHKTYRHYYPNRNGQDTIPAAVVAAPDDTAIIANEPGSVSVDQIADFVSARLN
jgi:hypothetical protein